MGWFDWLRSDVAESDDYAPSRGQIQRQRSFAAAENSHLFAGWTTQTSAIDAFLRQQLTPLRARSREQTHNNPLLKRHAGLQRKNVAGGSGITVYPKVTRLDGSPDVAANQAIKAGWLDWQEPENCDIHGRLHWIDLQRLWVRTAAVDGEFVARIHETGKYGLQFENIDPELLDVSRNQVESNGNVTRLGVEYAKGWVVAYWFRDVDVLGNYTTQAQTRVPAGEILHGFIPEWPNQSRGIPWGYASLRRLKHLDAYDDSALTAARAGASKMGFLEGAEDDDEELDGDLPIMDFSPGTIEKLTGDTKFVGFDPHYPTEAYAPFTKKAQRDCASGVDLTYASLTGDMSDVNYSSIRYGGQDERDGFIDDQAWLIRSTIKPVYERFIRGAVLRQVILIGRKPLARPVRDYYPAHYQGRRWLSTDPQKEAKANESDLHNQLTSPQRIIAARGDDPDEIAAEIQEWQQKTGVTHVTKDA